MRKPYLLLVLAVACGDDNAKSEIETPQVVEDTGGMGSSCTYTNRFSASEECATFVGTGWTPANTRESCSAEMDSRFSATSCDMPSILGTCTLDQGSPLEKVISFPGDDPESCALTAIGCTQFASGIFAPSTICDAVDPQPEQPQTNIGGVVFVPPQLICSESNNETPGLSTDEEVCTWQAIGGCTEPGRKFADYASCDPVMSQRPFAPVPPSTFKTEADDPLLSDESFLAEVEWVKEEAEACGCVCCHTTGIAPNGAAAFDTAAEGIWTDTFTTRGLAIAAGWIDSAALGAHTAETNNGFDRTVTGLPTTDVDRMVTFFEGELARRGAERADFDGSTPIGGPLYTQATFEPEPCTNNAGISADGTITWSGGPARYVLVLSAGSPNPGVPPNLDKPYGTLWKLDVDHTAAPVNSGIIYGQLLENTKQDHPSEGEAVQLITGETYYLYVLRDVGSPIERCLFEF